MLNGAVPEIDLDQPGVCALIGEGIWGCSATVTETSPDTFVASGCRSNDARAAAAHSGRTLAPIPYRPLSLVLAVLLRIQELGFSDQPLDLLLQLSLGFDHPLMAFAWRRWLAL